MQMSPTIKLVAAIIALVAMIASTMWARLELEFSSILAVFSSIIIFLGLIADGEVFSWLNKKWPSKFSWMVKPLLKTIHSRFNRDPVKLIEFMLPDNEEAIHRVASYVLADDYGSGLLKTLVHHPPNGDPYDILITEGNSPSFTVLDLDQDGQLELFVDAGVGVHSHRVHVYRLSPLHFSEVQGSPIFADWGPVSVVKRENSSLYEINILVGAGAAGSNASLHHFQLGLNGLQEIREKHI